MVQASSVLKSVSKKEENVERKEEEEVSVGGHSSLILVSVSVTFPYICFPSLLICLSVFVRPSRGNVAMVTRTCSVNPSP